MRAAAIPARLPAVPFRSKRLLALAGDEKLVEQIRRGNEAAFEVAFERYGGGILGFCRHMLGSREEAEDAVQHTFAAAFHDLQRAGERPLALKPWLYSIARNRCVSVLRLRRERATERPERLTAGLAEQVERRAELRDLLRDLRELPEEQRAALLLSEASGLSHVEIANVLGCEVARVKALVFRARSALIQRRAARETPCVEIREQLANLRGGSLRRGELRHHLRECAGCRAYREQVKQQRRMLAAVLPVAPTLGLKSSVLSALGLGGGAGGGGLAAGIGAAGSASFGSATLAKVALVGVLAGGGAVAGKSAIDEAGGPPPERQGPVPATAQPRPAGAGGGLPAAATDRRPNAVDHGAPPQVRGAEREHRPSRAGREPRRPGAEREHGRVPSPPGVEKRTADVLAPPPRGRLGTPAPSRGETKTAPPGHGGQARGRAKPTGGKPHAGGRGPIGAPPPQTPVRRGPPEPTPAAERPTNAKLKPKAPPTASPDAQQVVESAPAPGEAPKRGMPAPGAVPAG